MPLPSLCGESAPLNFGLSSSLFSQGLSLASSLQLRLCDTDDSGQGGTCTDTDDTNPGRIHTTQCDARELYLSSYCQGGIVAATA